MMTQKLLTEQMDGMRTRMVRLEKERDDAQREVEQLKTERQSWIRLRADLIRQMQQDYHEDKQVEEEDEGDQDCIECHSEDDDQD